MGQRAIYVIPVTLLLLAESSLALKQEFDFHDSRAQVLSVEEDVHLALAHNLNLHNTVDSVSSARISQGLAESRFDIKLTPAFASGWEPPAAAHPAE